MMEKLVKNIAVKSGVVKKLLGSNKRKRVGSAGIHYVTEEELTQRMRVFKNYRFA